MEKIKARVGICIDDGGRLAKSCMHQNKQEGKKDKQ